MSLDEFKSIFFMEWGHRMFGRLIGVAFSLPMIYFAVRGRINASLGTRLGLLFTMGGTQVIYIDISHLHKDSSYEYLFRD